MTKRPSKIDTQNPLTPAIPALDASPDFLIATVVVLALIGAALAVAGVVL